MNLSSIYCGLAAFAAFGFFTACSAGGGTSTGTDTGGAAGSSGTGDGGGITGTIELGGGGGHDNGGGLGTVDPNDTRTSPPREPDPVTGLCLRVAVLGSLDGADPKKDVQPLITWFNDNSGGTATVTMVPTQPVLDATFLNQYDILVLANVNGWVVSQADKDAVETWSRTTDGGIVALTGFVSTGGEPAATSALISFSGISFNTTTTAPSGSSKTQPVFYEGDPTNLKQCLQWAGMSTNGQSCANAIHTDSIPFTQQTGSLSKLTNNVNYLGAFVGWGITAPAGAVTVATDPVTNQPMAVAYEYPDPETQAGTGRLVVWGDEWIMYGNQWAPPPGCVPKNQLQDESNQCWVPPDNTADPPVAGFFHSVESLYQTKQFWYNAINWVAPPNKCNFVISDPEVIVVK